MLNNMLNELNKVCTNRMIESTFILIEQLITKLNILSSEDLYKHQDDIKMYLIYTLNNETNANILLFMNNIFFNNISESQQDLLHKIQYTINNISLNYAKNRNLNTNTANKLHPISQNYKDVINFLKINPHYINNSTNLLYYENVKLNKSDLTDNDLLQKTKIMQTELFLYTTARRNYDIFVLHIILPSIINIIDFFNKKLDISYNFMQEYCMFFLIQLHDPLAHIAYNKLLEVNNDDETLDLVRHVTVVEQFYYYTMAAKLDDTNKFYNNTHQKYNKKIKQMFKILPKFAQLLYGNDQEYKKLNIIYDIYIKPDSNKGWDHLLKDYIINYYPSL